MTDSAKLSPATSGFGLAAAITIFVNAVLACAKDGYAPLKAVMKSLGGHDWTTQGLFDLLLFIGLGLIFMKTRAAQRIDPSRLTGAVIGAVVIAGLGLALWYAIF